MFRRRERRWFCGERQTNGFAHPREPSAGAAFASEADIHRANGLLFHCEFHLFDYDRLHIFTFVEVNYGEGGMPSVGIPRNVKNFVVWLMVYVNGDWNGVNS